MPEFAQYQVWLCDWNTNKTYQLFPGNDFISLTWQHLLNDMGVFELTLVAETDTKDLFTIDYGILIERDYGDGLYEEGYFFHLDEEEWMETDAVDEHYWKSSGFSPEWMLDQPSLQPLANLNPNYRSYDTWWDYGPADDVIKKMASESMGGGVVDADREFTTFTVEGNTGEGNWGCYDGRYDRLIDAMRATIGEDGARGNCDFRVAHVTGGFELRTYYPYYGTDRRKGNADGNKPTVFSLELDNVLNPRRKVLRYAEATVAIGGWQGAGMHQDTFEEENATAIAESPYRRREVCFDVSDVVQPDTIPGILQQYLIDYGKAEIVEFKLLQTNACLYGRDWNLGDLVTLELWGSEYDMRITEVLGRIDGDNEEVIEGQAKLWTRGI